MIEFNGFNDDLKRKLISRDHVSEQIERDQPCFLFLIL